MINYWSDDQLSVLDLNEAKNLIVFIFATDSVYNIATSLYWFAGSFECFIVLRDWSNIDHVHFEMKVLEFTVKTIFAIKQTIKIYTTQKSFATLIFLSIQQII